VIVCQVLNYLRSQVYCHPQTVEDESDPKGVILTLVGQLMNVEIERPDQVWGGDITYIRFFRKSSFRQRSTSTESFRLVEVGWENF
jgi:hypothetical protein